MRSAPGDPAVEVALTFLACGPFDIVGNADPVQAAQIRADTVDEMIRATGEAFLGLTVGWRGVTIISSIRSRSETTTAFMRRLQVSITTTANRPGLRRRSLLHRCRTLAGSSNRRESNAYLNGAMPSEKVKRWFPQA